ncbi:hypothetical protein DFR86_10045 [Acidianus sulfidivorans JP7]|uniref:Amidinotransferase n=1 Tax=Acidianus sulfidivorans JP7 TaxID=619593 RepID=A0A2U9IPA9_9CREN|nr:arginine deiminase family protein [Acidianus sulfidivorans]AWR97845.1 hypothetical protein DFR86_10045 [Acidianus sulfidivorans JP7]
MLRITAEWKKTRLLLLHEPGIEMFYGILDPDTFLYMRRFNVIKAIQQHKNLQETLKKLGIEILKLKELIISTAEKNRKFKKDLENTALNFINFEGDGNIEKEKEEFKNNIDDIDSETLFNIILLNPIVLSHKALGISEYTPRVLNEEPLANLYFIRDPAIITDKGIVIGRMSKRVRRRETEIIKLAFKALSENPSREIKEPAYLEGGDYMPFEDFVIIGSGERTTVSGILQISDLLDFNEIAIAYNPEIENTNDYMLTMHLDMYLNAPKEGTVVGNVEILKKTLVHIFTKNEDNLILKQKTNLFDYLTNKKIRIINITLAEQLSYASNFLTIDNGKILSPDVEKNMKNVIQYLEYKKYTNLENIVKSEYTSLKENNNFFPNKKELKDEGIDYVQIDISELTGGFGGIHCMTMPIKKE